MVLLSPYEHHSNMLLWRESGAHVVTVPEGPDGQCLMCPTSQVHRPDPSVLCAGGLDVGALRKWMVALRQQNRPLVIASFSAASNVTGVTYTAQRIAGTLG